MTKGEAAVTTHVDLQCGTCGTLCHRGKEMPRYCSCCGAAYDRTCIKCRMRVDMNFEEWWPTDDECVRTYTPAKRCPQCNADLEVGLRSGAKHDSAYEH